MLKRSMEKLGRLPVKLFPYMRTRHIRGRGVHSPFVYGIIRNSLIFGKGYKGEKDRLYAYLKIIGIPHRTAMQLQNLHNYCGYRKTVVYSGVSEEQFGEGKPALSIFTPSCNPLRIYNTGFCDRPVNGAIVVISPRGSKEKASLCKEMAANGECISIDNRRFILFFYGTGHAPMHYKL